jgi:uncharacterized membrane protein YkvA (DUF1232 family)
MSQKDYTDSYTEEGFWNKITKMPGDAGCALLRAAFTLYVLLRESSTPAWVKASILGSLGYFIFPLDIIPDIIPVIGYADDLALITLLLGQLYAFINQDIKDQVESMLPKKCRGNISIKSTYKA